MKGIGVAFLGLLLVFATGSDALAGISDGPYLQNVSTDGVTVCFTSTGADAEVDYGLTTGYGDSVYSGSPINVGAGSNPLFQLRLEGLSPNTVYHYRVTSGGQTTEDRTFSTAPNPGVPFRFCAYGDDRRGGVVPVHQAIVDGMLAEAPGMVIHSGDIVNFDQVLGTPVNWEWVFFFQKSLPLLSRVPMFLVRGNHDDDTNLFELFMDNPTANSGSEHYYSFEYGNAHFLAVDSTLDVCSGAQNAFIQADLAAHAGGGPLFVFFHHPPFSNGEHGGNTQTHDCLAPLFQEYGVDIVFGGHDHLYTRYGPYPEGAPVPGINGVNYIVSGGGGAPLYIPNYRDQAPIVTSVNSFHFMVLDINGNDISVVVKNEGGVVLDAFNLNAAANDGLYDRTAPLPPKGEGGLCGTVPAYGNEKAPAGAVAMGLYLIPIAFLFLVRRRVNVGTVTV